MSLRFLLSLLLFLGLFLSSDFHDLFDRLVLLTFRPGSSSEIWCAVASSADFVAHIELDKRSESLEEEFIKEFLDKASQFTWGSVDEILKSESKLEKELLELVVNKLNALDVEKMLGKDSVLPLSIQSGKLFFISCLLGLLIEWLFFVFLGLLLLWNFLWGLAFFSFLLSLFGLKSGLFFSFSFGGCFLVDSEEHWVGSDVSIEFLLVDLGLKSLIWRIVLFDHVDDFLKLQVESWAFQDMSLSEHVEKVFDFNGDVLSSVMKVS